MATVEIHEFSTGIHAERLPDGGWRSRGFRVGEYMNLTLPYIPETVKRAIANNRFEVFKARHSQEPSFVGRVVPSTENEEDDWSVVASVTPGQDEGGRSTSFYRYFLCEGRDSLWKILAWMEHYQQQNGGKWPVFDPFAIKQLGESHKLNVNNKPKLKLPDDWQSFLNENYTPVILSLGYASDLKMINAMAEVKANGEQVSWAYNVEIIERPDLFIIIQAADEQSYQRLMQRRQGQANNTQLLPLSVDEAAIKSAINGLISGSQVRTEWIQTILATLQENRLTDKQWKKVFDDRGAANAIADGNSNPQMGRLLTLRAFVLPETLPEFLGWLWPIEGKKKQENPQEQASLDFQNKLKSNQHQIQRKLNQFEENFTEGINNVIKALIEGKITVEAVLWLLISPRSIWAPYRGQIKNNIQTDLITIDNYFSSKNKSPELPQFECEEKLWSNLCSYWDRKNERSSLYKPFAELFAGWVDSEFPYRLSAYFYQVSEGSVPTKIFKLALPQNGDPDKGKILGLEVKRNIPFLEQTMRLAFKYSKIFCIGSIILITHGGMYLWGENNGFNRGWEQGLAQSGQKRESENVQIPVPADKKNTALEKFPITAEAINEIINELTNSRYKKIDRMPSNQEIIEEIEKTLVFNNNDMAELLDYKKAISKRMLGIDWRGEIASAQEKWVEAIYLYQKSKPKLSADGYIEPGKETAKSLKCDVADSLELRLIADICREQNERRQDTQQNVTGMTEDQKQEAKAAFLNRTYPAITQILTELQEDLKYLNLDGESIHRAIRETLGVGKADYGKARKGEFKGVEALSPAIYKYQKTKTFFPPDGIIDIPQKPRNTSTRNTFNVLKEEVMEKLRANPDKYKVPGGK